MPAVKSLSITSSIKLAFTVSSHNTAWLFASPTSGSTPATISVSAKPGTLAAGTYTSSVSINSSSGSVTVPVTLTVTAASTARLGVSPTSLTFSYQQGGTVPPSKSLSVTSSVSTRTVSFTDAVSGASWLSVGRTSGSTPSSITVSV